METGKEEAQRMRPRPVYRWRSFWLGLLMLTSVGWMWARSTYSNERIAVTGRDVDTTYIELRGGRFRVSSWRERSGQAFEVDRASWPYVGQPENIPVWALWDWDDNYQMDRWIAFPMWFPFVGILVPWGGWLVWRWRRVLKGTSNIERPTSNDDE
jgi:hypothetical protein